MPVAVALQNIGTQLMSSSIVDAIERAAQRVAWGVVLTSVGAAAAGWNGLLNAGIERGRGLAKSLVAHHLQQVGTHRLQFSRHLLEHQRVAAALAQLVGTRVGRHLQFVRYTDGIGNR